MAYRRRCATEVVAGRIPRGRWALSSLPILLLAIEKTQRTLHNLAAPFLCITTQSARSDPLYFVQLHSTLHKEILPLPRKFGNSGLTTHKLGHNAVNRTAEGLRRKAPGPHNSDGCAYLKGIVTMQAAALIASKHSGIAAAAPCPQFLATAYVDRRRRTSSLRRRRA